MGHATKFEVQGAHKSSHVDIPALVSICHDIHAVMIFTPGARLSKKWMYVPLNTCKQREFCNKRYTGNSCPAYHVSLRKRRYTGNEFLYLSSSLQFHAKTTSLGASLAWRIRITTSQFERAPRPTLTPTSLDDGHRILKSILRRSVCLRLLCTKSCERMPSAVHVRPGFSTRMVC